MNTRYGKRGKVDSSKSKVRLKIRRGLMMIKTPIETQSFKSKPHPEWCTGRWIWATGGILVSGVFTAEEPGCLGFGVWCILYDWSLAEMV